MMTAKAPSRPVSVRVEMLVKALSLATSSVAIPAPRQYVISLAGGISITASDGETRHIGAGEIVLVEDTTGKGHITRSSGDKPRHTIFVPID